MREFGGGVEESRGEDFKLLVWEFFLNGGGGVWRDLKGFITPSNPLILNLPNWGVLEGGGIKF